jgi:hypothetical protein
MPVGLNTGSFIFYIYVYLVDNGRFYKVILAQFLTFYRLIILFTMLHKKNSSVLCTDCLRICHVCN